MLRGFAVTARERRWLRVLVRTMDLLAGKSDALRYTLQLKDDAHAQC